MSVEHLTEIIPEVSEAIESLTQTVKTLSSAAYVDGLTGLMNGVALRKFEAAKERTHTFGAVFVDLTGFKRINDAHGHEAGDAALRESGRVLQAIGKAHGAFVFRQSGDEFILLTRRHDAARSCAEAVAEHFASGLRFSYGDVPLLVHAAVGFSLRQDNEATLSMLIQQADAACRIAKDEGSNKPVEWTVKLSRDDLVSERRRCTICQATTSIMVRKSRRSAEALRTCANCGRALPG